MPALDVSTQSGTRAPGPGEERRRRLDWRVVRWTALALYVVGCVVFLSLQGIPTDRLGLGLAIIVLLSISVLCRGWAAWWQMMRDWLPFEARLATCELNRVMDWQPFGARLATCALNRVTA